MSGAGLWIKNGRSGVTHPGLPQRESVVMMENDTCAVRLSF